MNLIKIKRPNKNLATIHRILNPGKKGISFDPQGLNTYYTTMAENLTETKSTIKNEITKLINALPSSSNQDQFYLQKINYNQVLHEIKSIRSDCSTSAYTIPISFIKSATEEIALSLTEVINNYIEHYIFPSQWKITKKFLIPKIDIPLASKGFRPISLLRVLSKVFEHIIMKQLCSFLEDHVIYSKTQLGFHKHHSTNTLLIKI